MDLIRASMEALNTDAVAEVLLYVVNGLIGFIFGSTLIYIKRVFGKRQFFFLVPVIAALYGLTFLLNDVLFALRLIQVFLLLHIAITAVHIIRNSAILALSRKTLTDDNDALTIDNDMMHKREDERHER